MNGRVAAMIHYYAQISWCGALTLTLTAVSPIIRYCIVIFCNSVKFSVIHFCHSVGNRTPSSSILHIYWESSNKLITTFSGVPRHSTSESSESLWIQSVHFFAAPGFAIYFGRFTIGLSYTNDKITKWFW